MHRVRLRLRRDGHEEEREVRVRDGATLLAAARQADLPVARACGAQLLCGRCGLRVVEGAASLSAESEREQRSKHRNRVQPQLRLACASRIHGPLTVTADYW